MNMTDAEYREWWKLHRRAAVGETLTDAENVVWEEGLRRLHSEEKIGFDPEDVRQTDERIAFLEEEVARLMRERDSIDRRIAELEAARATRRTAPASR